MSTATANKLKTKDIITVVLLALINVVIFFASSVLYATPITIILMPVFFALLEGIVYFIIGTKVKKPGAILIYSIVRAIMGGYLPYIILFILSGFIAELLLWKMGYGNAKALTISYIINQVLAAFGSTIIPYAIAAKAMADQMVTDGRQDAILAASQMLQSWVSVALVAGVIVAALIGAAIGAEEIQIWTDIDGMHNNDPRIVEKTSPVRHLHFEEAAELAYFGAKILHPTCILPAKLNNIPVRLLNTMQPEAPGTMISNMTEKGKIKAVAAKDNITSIKIKSGRMLLATGFLRKVFEIFENYQTPIDMVTTSEVGVSVTIDNRKHLEEIVDDLKKYGTVTVDEDMVIVCVVGDLEWDNVGFEARIVQAMKDVPVRMISYGGSNYNVSLLIKASDKTRALQALSDHLFNNKA